LGDMPFSSGTRLGPYEIVTLVGAGGMGEVYRARDTRLSRDVAIKVSKEQFSERFEREARAVAALNHPHICQLYDVGPDYLVMEYVEGETLKGPLKLDEAMPIIRQLIDGIEAAHDRNIVHRDLKPANIKITPEGVVKILDFGLAKASAPEPEGNPETSPTITMEATVAGTVLGTAAYMAPEQARGKTADKRSDVWSFGVVVYELVTGKRAFQGESVVETLGAVIHQEPDWGAVPERARRLLRWCLEKDPKQRLHAIGDARRVLEEVPERVVEAPAPWRGSWLAWSVAAALALALAVLALALWRVTRPVAHPLVRLDVDLGAEILLPALSSTFTSVVLSPDGRRLVYVASVSGGRRKLYTRRLDQPKATELRGTEGASSPFFSPDGLWVGFYTPGKINKVSVEGGAVVPLTEISGFGGASWVEDGNIIASEFRRGLLRISSGGGPLTLFMERANGDYFLVHPQVLPGGKAVLFGAIQAPLDTPSIDVFTFADRRRKTVVPAGVSARYLPTSDRAGHLVYTNKGTLFAILFDLERFETRGTAVPVLDDVAGQFAFSPSGALVYRKGVDEASAMRTIQWLDSAGKKQPLLDKPGMYSTPRLSPDGKRLAMAVREGSNPDIWVYEQLRDATTKLTFGEGAFAFPVWSPDGRFVVFQFLGNGIFWARADGGGQPQPLLQSKTLQFPWSFTRDGKRMAYYENDGTSQIWTVSLKEDSGQLKAGKPEQFLKSQFADINPAFSPDGRWLAYQSSASGKFDVYVRPFPPPASGQERLWPISNGGGAYPVWSPNGRDLLYQSGDQIMAESYTVKGDAFVPQKPRVWIAKLGGTQWGLASDGKRVAVITPAEAREAPKPDHTVVFLLNFFDYLRQRVPMEK
jgi:serine/threonine-protein kinase